MKKVLLGLFAVSMISLVGCKDDDEKTCDLNNANLQGAYKITAVSYKADASTPAVDDFATWDPCEKDDIITLSANFAASITDAGVQCTPSTAETGNWMFNSTNNQLTVAFGSFNSIGTVTNFSCSGMNLTISGPGVGEETVITFAKQ